MRRLQWHMILFKNQIGWAGLIGIASLIYACLYFSMVISPAQKLMNTTQQAWVETNATQLMTPVQPAIVPNKPREQLNQFDSDFPDIESVNFTWEKVSKLAKKSGLIIDHGLYSSSSEKHAGLLRYDLNMPVKAPYPVIRDFLAEVIQTIPNIAVAQINFKRDSVDSPLTDANIDLALYVKAP